MILKHPCLKKAVYQLLCLVLRVILPRKKTFPALFNLYRQAFLQSHEVYIFGYARTNISVNDLRYRIRGYLTPNKNAAQGHTLDVSKFLQLREDLYPGEAGVWTGR
ncbi:hypothetical protein AgCh_006286 [Apium graveolens]